MTDVDPRRRRRAGAIIAIRSRPGCAPAGSSDPAMRDSLIRRPRSKMSFVFLSSPTSVHTQRWVDGLRARGHQVIVVPNNEGGRRGVSKVIYWARQMWRVRMHLRHAGAVLIVHWIPGGIRATALLGIHPRIGFALGSDIYLTTRETPRRALRARQQTMFLRGCDAIAAPSDDLLRAAIAAGAPPDRAQRITFGVDLARFASGPDPVGLRARLGLEGRRVILSNRAIAPIYRQQVVVRALSELPADVVVLMTRHRAWPSEVAAVEGLAEGLGLSERVRIVSEIADEDMGDLYRLADVVVSIPSSDGGPSTILEALASGCQVVASDVPSVRGWLAEVDPSALVPVDDERETALAISRALARTPLERSEHARRSRSAVVRLADQERALTALEHLHDTLLGIDRGTIP